MNAIIQSMLALVGVLGLVGIGLGVAYVPDRIQMKVDEALKDAVSKINKVNIDLTASDLKLKKSESELTEVKSDLEKVSFEKKKLETVVRYYEYTFTLATRESIEIKNLLGATERERNSAKKQLEEQKKIVEEFHELGFSADDIRKKLDELKVLMGAKEASERDKMIQGIIGTIRSVDSKYGFVTIDVGSVKGVKAAGLMTVSRNGKFVGQIKVRAVQPSVSIADVVKDTTKGELKVGDVVAVTNF